MEERRKEIRKYLNYFSRVTDRETGFVLGYLVDLTTGGALLVGNIPLNVGTVFQLRVDLPEEKFTQSQLDMDAKAVWCQPDSDPELYRTGLKLVTSQPGDLFILERLLSGHSSGK
jgi:hypothetical protein